MAKKYGAQNNSTADKKQRIKLRQREQFATLYST
jgi:hypothetical protein